MNLTLQKKYRNVTSKLLFKVLLFVTFLNFYNVDKLNAQNVVYNYNYSESAGNTYTAITGGTVVATGVYANASFSSNVVLPFSFQYNGAGYTNLTVYDNGFVVIGNTALPAATTTLPVSTVGAYSGAVACYGTNLRGQVASSEVRYEVIGSAPNRVFVAQYKDVQRGTALTSYAGLMNMQIRLYENTNVIELIYRDTFTTLGAPVTPVTGQVGLRGNAATNFNTRTSATATYPATTATTVNTQGLITSNVNGYLAGTRLVWTPCFAPTGIIATMQGDNSTLDINWTNPSFLPTAGFDYEVRTSGAPGSGAVGLFASGNTLLNTVSVPGLSTGITYYIYIKPNCKTVWMPHTISATNVPTQTVPSSITVTPNCPVATIPYTQNFESAIVPAIPNCNSAVVVSGTLMQTVDNTVVTPNYGFTNKNVATVGSLAQNTWYFTQQINFPSAGTYRLSYKYGRASVLTFLEQKMRVKYGAVASAAGMTTLLADHNSIKLSPLNNVINFTVTTPGNYYIGFNGYAIASQGVLQIDDINVDFTSCVQPTALSAPVALVTSTTALLSWTAPASAPASGYQYINLPASSAVFTAGSFVIGNTYRIVTLGSTNFTTIGALSNTVGTVFTATAVGSGTGTAIVEPINTSTITGTTAAGVTIQNLTGLTPSTTYYFWVRSNCGGETSIWSLVGTYTTLPPVPTPCTPAPISVDGTGITNVTFGSINNTTGAEVGNYGDYTNLSTTVAQTTTVNVAITFNTLTFDYNTKIWVDWNDDGDFYDVGENVATGLSASTSPNTLNLTFVVPTLDSGGFSTLGQHRLRIGGADINTLTGVLAGEGPCYNGSWGTFEDYTIFVNVAPPALTLSNITEIMCEDDTTPTVTVTSTHSDFQVYSWSPSAGVNGDITSGYTFNPTGSGVITYILTATQTSGNFSSNSVTYTLTINPKPTPIVITPTPTAAIVCQNDTTGVQLTATGGIVSGTVDIINENFNNATNSFTTINNSVGGPLPASAAWTLRPSPYTTTRPFGQQTLTSNDASQFYMSDSDAQGGGGTTNTELISPVFSLAPPPNTYTDASLSFWHFYRDLGGDANVDISTNGGGSWNPVPLATYNSTQGTPSGFVNVVINLSSYIGQNNLRIRFRYNNAPFAWWWAIDNVKISGTTASSPVTWSPITGLYTNPACTAPFAYSGTAAATVYAKPTATTLYTASSVTINGCETTTDVTVTYTPIVAGTLSSNQVVSCINSLTDITLAGYTGTISSWQSANNPAFTGATTIAVTTPTLTTASMLPIIGTKYFRAVITNGTCTINSNAVTISIPAAVTWDGSSWDNVVGPDATTIAVFAGDYSSVGDLNACSVIISTGDVLFNSNHNLIVQNTVNTSGGTLTFDDDASLVQPNNVANAPGIYSGGNIGNIDYIRITPAVTRYDYTYWSSPVYPHTLFAVSPNTLFDKYIHFNPNNNNWESLPSNSLMEPGKGYIIRGSQFYITPTAHTATFTGRPNNGNITTTVLRNAGTINLIGNPYPSAIDIDLFLSDVANDAVIGGTIYLWTHYTPVSGGNYVFSDYATYNYTGGVGVGVGVPIGNNTPTGKVAAGQSFMIEAEMSIPINTLTPVIFKNSMRVIGNNSQFYKNGNAQTAIEALEKNRVWLEVFNTEGIAKQTLVGYIENATNNLDRGFDGKAVSVINELSLYSFIENEKLAIQGRALPFNENDIVPLGFSSATNGSYEIRLSNFDGFFDNQDVYIEDLYLNIVHNLKTSNYSFVTEIGTFEDRFQLRYTNTTLNTNQNIFNDNSVIIYKQNNNDIFINSSNTLIESVKVFDIRGRELFDKQKINNNQFVISNLNSSEQVLVVKVTSADGQIVNKKIIF